MTETNPSPAVTPEALHELFEKTRSVRRFQPGDPIPRGTLARLVDCARLSPSGANKQPLKFLLSSDAETNAKIFPCLSWAGYLDDWDGPAEGERPTGYIVILGDTEISESFGVDHGIAAWSIMLAARTRGLSGCIIGSVDRERLAGSLSLPDRYRILLVLALGSPAETVDLEDAGSRDDIKYWRGDDQTHHVPKRSPGELII